MSRMKYRLDPLVVRLLRKLRRALIVAKCKACAGGFVCENSKYRKRPDAEHRHWAFDKRDFWRCGLDDGDRKMIAEIDSMTPRRS